MNPLNRIALHGNILPLLQKLGFKKWTEPGQKAWLCNGSKEPHLLELIFVNIQGGLHSQLVRQLIDKRIDFVNVFMVTLLNRLFEFQEQSLWNLVLFADTIDYSHFLFDLGICLIQVGDDRGESTTGVSKTDHSNDLHNGAEQSLKIVCSANVTISDGGDCRGCPIE